MLYSQADREQATAERTKRMLVVLIPTILIALLAIASYIWFRMHRDESGWIWTALITIAAGAYFLFFHGVYLHPASLYKRHVDFMLDGNKRETTGALQSVDSTVVYNDGLDCHVVTVNVGDKNDPEDDRSFYLDALKPLPAIPLGTKVRILSNNRMIAGLDPAEEEK